MPMRNRGHTSLAAASTAKPPCHLRAHTGFVDADQKVPPELLDLQLQVDDEGLGIGSFGPRHGGFGLRGIGTGTLRQQRGLQRLNVVGQGIRLAHSGSESYRAVVMHAQSAAQ